MNGRILVVDDDAAACELLAEGLTRRGASVVSHTSPVDALRTLGVEDFSVVVTDHNMPGMKGPEFCERASASRPDVPVIVITAFGSLESAVAAIRAGAYDFLTKPFEIEALVLAIERALRHRSLREDVKRLRRAADAAMSFGELVGASPAMRAVYDLLDRVAPSEATVLVSGETGTGKELVARALHRTSRRSAGPFVALNCSAVPEPLLESELFGHARGAFTDARSARVGLLVQADGGTLFLDEVADMPEGMQAKLLRALQERTVRPVGGDADTAFDARIVAATNRDLESLVSEGRFRSDLFYRLNVIHVELPPLRARGNDVLLLAQTFVERFAAQSGKRVAGIMSATAERLLAYPWPGNVRELQNCMERGVALALLDQIAPGDLPEKVRSFRPSHVVLAADDPSELVPLEVVERQYILRVMEALGGNKTLAARVLGVDRKTLHRKLERYGGGSGPAQEA